MLLWWIRAECSAKSVHKSLSVLVLFKFGFCRPSMHFASIILYSGDELGSTSSWFVHSGALSIINKILQASRDRMRIDFYRMENDSNILDCFRFQIRPKDINKEFILIWICKLTLWRVEQLITGGPLSLAVNWLRASRMQWDYGCGIRQ